MNIRLQILSFWAALALAFALFGCGGSTELGSETIDESSESDELQDASAADATAALVTDFPLNTMPGYSTGLSGMALEEAETSEEYSGEAEQEGEFEGEEESSDTYGDCSFDEDNSQTICNCPGGGTVTQIYEDIHTQDPGSEARSWRASFRMILDRCVMFSCGDRETIVDGEVTGEAGGDYPEEGDHTFTMVQETAETCGGLTINDRNLGFRMAWNVTNFTEETFSGHICFDPPGEVIEFDSPENLWGVLDPEGVCTQ